jgi:ubiquinone/menaquinone biosynthesis C-methylase UbiE
MFTDNRDLYRSPRIVQDFAAMRDLQPPEIAILERLRPELPEMRMLDIGVGAGRTTHCFAPLAFQYVGVDYSENMVEECRRSFPFPERFRVADAAAMPEFADQWFDFVLFSFNGLDEILSPEGRAAALGEMRRVTKPGGIVCFSSHNLQAIPKLFTVQFHRHPMRLFQNAKFSLRMRLANKSARALCAEDQAIVQEPHVCNTARYYIKPTAQIEQLEASGLTDVEVYDLRGRIVASEDLPSAVDPWLYYFCRR